MPSHDPMPVDTYVNRVLLGRKPVAPVTARCDVCRYPTAGKLTVWRGYGLCPECVDMARDYVNALEH